MSNVWSNYNCRFRRSCVLVGSFYLVSSAQVQIKEKVDITPRLLTPAPTTANTSQGPLLKFVANSFGTGSHVATTRPGVVINGSLTVTPSTIPNKTALEIFLNGFKIHKQINGCGGSTGDVNNPLPLTFAGCGGVSLSGNSWSPFFSLCLQQRMASQGHAVVDGNSATITVDGDFNIVPQGVHWTAVFSLTASLDPAYEATTIAVTPTANELINGGSTTIAVEVRNGLGQLLSVCTGNDPILATASLQANGPYAYLQVGSQAGSTVTFPLSAGKGVFSLVLDQTNGIIPECLDNAAITVSVDNASGSSQVTLKCTYPKPTVSITSPQNEATFIVTSQDQPVIEFTEDHTPAPGEDFEPEISWKPSPTIETKDYFDQFEEDTTITVVVEARNEVSSAKDSVRITLIKQELFCTQVNFGSGSIKAGDTTSLTFQKVLNDGTVEEFEDGQSFNVSVSGDGLLLKDSATGSSLNGVSMPVYFIAPSAIEGDSVEISVFATPTNSGGGVASAFRVGAQKMAAAGAGGGGTVAAGQDCEVRSITVKKRPELAYFDVEVQSQEIKFKETTKITVVARDQDDQEFALDHNAKLTFTVEADETYATFIGADKREVQVIPVVLPDVSYGEANSGVILLSATVANPEAPIKQKVRVYLQDDPSKKGDKEVTVKPGLVEILLGETKYFQARESFDQENLIIDEVPTPEIVGDGMAIDVWENDPIVKKQGDKIGVYWEKQKKIYPTDKPQPDGIIRVVGRYWDSTQTHSVELIAKRHYESSSKDGRLEVEVKKPSALGNLHGRNRDVRDMEINIDDSCIVYGGKYGIPPHFLKSQISIESPRKTFVFDDGATKEGFAAGYRYEPYTTQFQLVAAMKRNPFYVLINSLREPPPPDHKHVRFLDYIKDSPVKVWYFVEHFSQLVNETNPSIFGIRMPDGRMDYRTLGYIKLQTEFDLMVNYFRDPQGGSFGLSEILTVEVAADSARQHFITFLKTKWRGGLDNIIAQSRIAASYGLFQTLYETALDREYEEDKDHLPEDLNFPELNLPISVEYQEYLMQIALGDDFDSGNNWPKGLEVSFRDYVYYPNWNRRRDYPNDVFNRLSTYSPKK